MGGMATWEDGPEYAPVERPAEFFVPPGPPLETQPDAPAPQLQPPLPRPAFDEPQQPGVPLVELVPDVADPRDPARPFDVVSSTVTAMDSAWGAAHATPLTAPPPLASIPPTLRRGGLFSGPFASAPCAAGTWE